MKILFPASSRALPTIAAGLTQLGAEVTQVEAYRTEAAALDVADCREWIARAGIGAVTFASPSAVTELERALGEADFDRLLTDAIAVAIGRTTARETHRARSRRRRGRDGDAALARPHHPSTAADETRKTWDSPASRPRRTRQSDAWRRMVRETRLTPDALIYPLFVVPGRAVRHAVESMPGICQLSVDEAVKEAQAAAAAGVPAVLLFAAPGHKDAQASAALDPQGLAAQAIAAIKEACPQLLVWADVCLCGATDHGHCGHVTADGRHRQRLLDRRPSPRSRSTTRAPAPMPWRRAT